MSWKMIAPTIMVAMTAPMGLSASIVRESSRRFSSRMRMQGLRHLDSRFRVAMHAANQETDLLDRRLAYLHHARQRAEVHHHQRVAKLQQFVEVLADDEDRAAARRQIDQ